eukprot:GHVH01013692.1.p1 GENE.GHVH01013692.1~~GHVH01013692.1.p1  ORF type:complete len:177 (+),score=17.18 GHVH01013692.1:1357-1887(+)
MIVGVRMGTRQTISHVVVLTRDMTDLQVELREVPHPALYLLLWGGSRPLKAGLVRGNYDLCGLRSGPSHAGRPTLYHKPHALECPTLLVTQDDVAEVLDLGVEEGTLLELDGEVGGACSLEHLPEQGQQFGDGISHQDDIHFQNLSASSRYGKFHLDNPFSTMVLKNHCTSLQKIR